MSNLNPKGIIMGGNKMIEMQNVSKIYGTGIVALSKINIKIIKGEFVFVVGPSGAGKSTFIKLLMLQELPTKGTIILAGKNITLLKQREIPYLRRNMGVVFQDFKLLLNKTVAENIAFTLEVIETSRKEIRRRVANILNLVGLEDKARVMPNELSGGEQQRVAIARAIVNNPPLLIADEPTGNLDPDTSWGIMELFSEINRRGTTILMASHDRDIVNRIKKRVVAMENGRIVRDEERGVYDYAN